MVEQTQQSQSIVQQKELVGEVVSDKMNKTIVVKVSRRVRHPKYHKVITKHKKFYAHDEKGEAGIGDSVRIVASRPLSKLKRWTLVEIVVKSKSVEKVEA